MTHKLSFEQAGRTGLRLHIICGRCGTHTECTKFGRWAIYGWMRKQAIAWLKSHTSSNGSACVMSK